MTKLENIDLQPIILKIYEAEPYSLARIEKIAQEYLRFIFLAQKVRFKPVPSQEVDMFWHYHILNTRLYRDFCDTHFGKFIDHMPLLKQVAKTMGTDNTFLKTQAAFKKHYGQYMMNLKPNLVERLYHLVRIL